MKNIPPSRDLPAAYAGDLYPGVRWRFRNKVTKEPVDLTGWEFALVFRRDKKTGPLGPQLSTEGEDAGVALEDPEDVDAGYPSAVRMLPATHNFSAANWYYDLKGLKDGFVKTHITGCLEVVQDVPRE